MVCRAQAAQHRIADDTRVHGGGRQGALLLHLVGGVVLHPTEKAARQVVECLKQAIVDIAPIDDVEAARLHQAPPLGPLRPVAGRDRDIDGPLAQDGKRHMHLRGPMLVVLPQGPGHARQGGQEAAIDGGQVGRRGLLGQRQVRAQAGPQRGQDLVQQGRVEDVGRFTQGTQGRLADPEALLHGGQGRRLLQAPQAGHHRVKEVQQQQAGILIVEQLPVPGAVPLRRGAVEVVKSGPSRRKYLNPWRVSSDSEGGRQSPMSMSFFLERGGGACASRVRVYRISRSPDAPSARIVPDTSAQSYERTLLDELNAGHRHELVYFDTLLGPGTASLAAGFPAVSVIVNDSVTADVLKHLAAGGTKLVATRSTGFNHIDVRAARELGIQVVRVVDYSPNSVAEFAVGLLLALNRKIPRAYNRTREGNFQLDGLMGFDLVGRTVGVIGTGKIGTIFARIMAGFGCKLLGFDQRHSPEFERLGGRYADAEQLQAEADIVSLHCPLTPQTHHIVNARTLARAKRGALLINTSRGGLVDTEAAIEALKSGQLGGMAIDVYEQEAGLFFRDLSSTVIADDVIQRLVSFPNVIVTGHQAFFTREALGTILDTTLTSIAEFAAGHPLANEMDAPMGQGPASVRGRMRLVTPSCRWCSEAGIGNAEEVPGQRH